MRKLGYIQAVRWKEYTYFYIRQSYRDKDKPEKVLKKTILKLGRPEETERKLKSWIENEEKKPSELSEFSSEDFKEWLAYVRKKVS